MHRSQPPADEPGPYEPRPRSARTNAPEEPRHGTPRNGTPPGAPRNGRRPGQREPEDPQADARRAGARHDPKAGKRHADTPHDPQPDASRADAGGAAARSAPRHLSDELARDDGALWQLIETLTRGDDPQLLHDVLRGVANLVAADEVSLYAGSSPTMLIAAQGPRVFAEQRQIVDRRLLSALRTRSTIALEPGDAEQGWTIAARTVIRSGLWVPSRPGTGVPAVVRVLRVRPQPFAAGTRRLLEIVVQRLAGVLQRMQQRDEQASAAERTQLFLVSASIAQELDFELVAERVAVGVTSVTDFSDATVEVRDGTTLRRVAAFGSGDLASGVTSPMERWRAVLVDKHIVGELTYRVPMRNGLPVADDDDGADATPGLVTQLQDRDGDVLGFLTLSRPRTGAEPSEQTVQTIELFARQAQIALVNASLYVEAKRQRDIAETLMRVTTAVSQSLDTEEILRTCCEAAQEHSVGERASIYLLEHGRVRLTSSHGRDAAVPALARGPVPLDDDRLLADAVQSGRPVVVDDLPAHERYRSSWMARALGLRSVALYPLRTGSDVLGVLVVDNHTTGTHFARHEAALLPQIAAQAAVALRQTRLHRKTREQAAHNARLVELTTTMTTTFEFEDIFRDIVKAVRSRMDGHSVAVLRVRGRDMHVLGTITDDHLRCPSPPQEVPVSDRLRDALAMVWERGTLNVDDVRMVPALLELARPETRAVLLAAPLERTGSSVLLTVSATRPDAYGREDERFVADLVRITGLAVRNADLFGQVSEAAQRDPLTGLLNRRVFWERLQERLATLDARTLALAVVDADNFKRINDRLGHAVGDAALKHIAARLQRSVRQTDEVFRIGGEEFTVIMPDAAEHDAHGVMSRTLVAVRRSREDLPPLSVSVGVAVAPHDGRTADTLFRAADRTLLRAKQAGKNRIVLRSQVG